MWDCVLKYPVKDVALILLFNVAQNKICVSFVILLLICHLDYLGQTEATSQLCQPCSTEKDLLDLDPFAFHFNSEDALIVCANKTHCIFFFFEC